MSLHTLVAIIAAMRCEPWCSKWTCNQPGYCGDCAPCAPNPPPPPLAPTRFARNPFATERGWFINPVLKANILHSTLPIAESDAERSALRHMASTPSAFWVDRKAKVRGSSLNTMEGILRNNSQGALCVFILYNLPARDCNAKASNGEIACGGRAGCEEGLREYRDEFIRPVSEVLQAFHRSVPTVVILEPDSLGNVVTNAGSGGCLEAVLDAYKQGIRHAVEELTRNAPTVALYGKPVCDCGWRRVQWAQGVYRECKIPRPGCKQASHSPRLANTSRASILYTYCSQSTPATGAGWALRRTRCALWTSSTSSEYSPTSAASAQMVCVLPRLMDNAYSDDARAACLLQFLSVSIQAPVLVVSTCFLCICVRQSPITSP